MRRERRKIGREVREEGGKEEREEGGKEGGEGGKEGGEKITSKEMIKMNETDLNQIFSQPITLSECLSV